MSRAQPQLKHQTKPPALGRIVDPPRTRDSLHTYYEANREHRSRLRPRYAVSVWYDWFVGVLLLAAIIGVLAYFLGWLLAVAVAAVVLVALGVCLNSVLSDTIEL